MKLATLNDGTRDGQLAIVARDLKTAHLADGIAPTLQAALDDWAFIALQLNEIYQQLNSGRGRRTFEFDQKSCMAPLPRAFQRADAFAYVNHVDRLRRASGAAMPASFWQEPLMYQGASDDLLGPGENIVLAHEAWGIDFGAELAVITDDVPIGSTPDQAQQHIKLLMLVNAISLRNLMPDELAKGFGFVQSKSASSCSPVAVTLDELGEAWKDGKVQLPLRSVWNGKLVGQPHAGLDMAFNFPQLLSHLTKTRNARAGTIVASGPVSNQDASQGYACIAEKRCQEMLADGVASTPFMLFGDSIKIDMLGLDGKSVFGAIDQLVKQSEARKQRPALANTLARVVSPK